jgi:RNA polymerase sigma-70 factor (ECF subfamily)
MVTTPWSVTEAAQAGDMDSFGLLYSRYQPVILHYVWHKTSDYNLAEDITSETFAKALASVARVKYQGKDIGGWFTTIARNLIMDHYRTTHEVATGFVSYDINCPSAEDIALKKYEETTALRALEHLLDSHKTCLILRFIENKSTAEVGELMNRNSNAVKALQHRAMRNLRKFINEGTQ